MDDYQFSYEDYKKRVYKNAGLSFYVIAFFVLLLIGLAFLLWPKQITNGKQKFYFVEIDSFLVYSDANNLAGEIQNKLGAGYVYYDTSYHVLASYYPSIDDAKKVIDNIIEDYPHSRLLTLECNTFNRHKNLSDKQNEKINEIILKNNEIFAGLYENIIKFDKNDININVLKQNFTIFSSSYNNIYQEVKDCFSENSKYYKAIKNLENINSCLSSFNNLVDNNEIFKLKYNLIKMIVEHCAFVNSF